MAKLSARNRYELARVEKETLPLDSKPCYTCRGDHSEGCTTCEGKGILPESCNWRRITRTLMSDGKILEKLDVRFRPFASWDPPTGRPHSYGWKVFGKAKARLTAERFVEVYAKAGFTQVKTRVPQ